MKRIVRFWLLPMLATVSFQLSIGVQAAEEPVGGSDRGVRYEIALGFNSWAALADLQPVGGGHFDEMGYSFSGAVHWPLRSVGEGSLLLGIDAGFLHNESDIPFATDNLIARGLYLVPSVKWKFDKAQSLSLDAGLGFYLVDIAELADEVFIETESWEESGVGGFVGATWDVASKRANRGLMLSFKVHFVDLGDVNDQDSFLPVTLGSNAGNLSGPIYSFQVGYRWE